MLAGHLARSLASPLARQLVASNSSFTPTDADAAEFIARAGVTDSNAKRDLDQFVLGAKSLGMWNNLVYVPCLTTHGGLHQLGGSANRTDTPWALVNATAGSFGVSIERQNDSNYLLTDQTVQGTAGNPLTLGMMIYQEQTPFSLVNVTPLAKRLGDSNQALGSSAYGAAPQLNLRYLAGQLTSQAAGTAARNNYRLAHMVAGSCNGTTAYDYLVGSTITSFTFGSNLSIASAKMSFYPAVYTNGQVGGMQGVYLYYGMLSAGGEAMWERFKNLIAQTILSRLTSRGNTRINISGQSNAQGNIGTMLLRLVTNELGPAEAYVTGTGGVSITQWIGTGPYARSARYKLDFWNNSGTQPWFQKLWLKDYGRYKNVVFWFQGETDSSTSADVAFYPLRLQTLIDFIVADYADPDMAFVIALIDYSPAFRSGTHASAPWFTVNFTLSGFTGGLSGLNGDYTLGALTNTDDPYVWTKSGYELKLVGNAWQFIETAGSTVLASATGAGVYHPAIATNYVDASGNAVAPSFGSATRLELVERLRKHQREICATVQNCTYFDTRSYPRSDGTHITEGTNQYADDLRAHIIANC